ncbi:MAG: imidazole glycerol phosphate synthase subunit HisH [Armatimonadota bacterium]|nr:imidazole glycerol phosphate synthase subunit HisH [Armatimonadota bacterium]MDR7450654.1 imidazole glycerol phosphate synthase subunit HisH [Armatimonadota bacterium]MDR7466213.1 imidazole glycerol phosphate synthase subunit HisH [Armatimonadota bacterium]MDR7492934.1 imidazole glycerol phosphate synthase subunit HisH [Armatimonadota bacterium]MDR7498309.1 imidazole glycerol phosphate synthase subunit HisH [Armatimonadota bacterium]
MRVGVIDYEAGNLQSISRALRAAGAEAVLIDRPPAKGEYTALVLPGVGAYAAAMRWLVATGLAEWIRTQVELGTPLVGVCLGMQLLYEGSEEGGEVRGFGLLPGSVRRLPGNVKVPHMGWNQLFIRRASPLVDGVAAGTHVYFVHSYAAIPGDAADVVAVTSYGMEVPAIVQRGRLIGLQFHPEKSGAAGERLLRNVLRSVAAASGFGS